jgi:galactose mutarotase-like enzyme
LQVDGRELLLPPGDEPLLSGCYPMAPWAGRLAQGRFHFAGEPIDVPVDLPPHAIHGLGTSQVWMPAAGGFDLGLDGLWPLGGRVTTRFDLTENGLTLELTVTAGEQPMPAVLGWHPCFRRRLGDGEPAELGFTPRFWWPRGADGVPTGEQEAPPPGPWDDCFGGVERSPTLTWPGALTVTLEADTETWVVFDERDDTICVEPQTAPPDAFNVGGATVLDPGQAAGLRLTIGWGGQG